MIVNGTIDGSDFYHTNTAHVDKADNSKVQEMMVKFDNYFMYAFDGKNLSAEDADYAQECSTTSDCGYSGFGTSCCVNAVMKNELTGEWCNMYRCMTQAIVDANF